MSAALAIVQEVAFKTPDTSGYMKLGLRGHRGDPGGLPPLPVDASPEDQTRLR